MTILRISKEAVLKVFRQQSCLDLRKLAARLGVGAGNAILSMVIGDLARRGQIRRLGGKGRHAIFILATFEG